MKQKVFLLKCRNESFIVEPILAIEDSIIRVEQIYLEKGQEIQLHYRLESKQKVKHSNQIGGIR